MPRIAALLVLAAAIAVGSASGPGPAAADSTTPSVYTDPAGDSGSAPDLTKVTLTPGSGTVAFDLIYSGAWGSDGAMVVAIDSDRNAQTGKNGLDYLYLADSTGAVFVKWDGAQWADFAYQPTNPGLTSTDFTFTITLADIGGVTSFDFVAVSLRGNDGDSVPNTGVATYPAAAPTPPTTTTTTTQPPPAPKVKVKALMIPSNVLLPKAGNVLRVPRLQLLLTDGTSVPVETQTCTLEYKGKKLPSIGGCAWKIPKAYKNVRLVLTITYTFGGFPTTTKWPVYPS